LARHSGQFSGNIKYKVKRGIQAEKDRLEIDEKLSL